MKRIVLHLLGDVLYYLVGIYTWTFENWKVCLPVAFVINCGLFLGSYFGQLPMWPLIVSLVLWPSGPIVIVLVAAYSILVLGLAFGLESDVNDLEGVVLP